MAKSHAARGADPSGPGQRQQRVAELIRAAVAEVLQRGDLHEPGLAKVVVTVPEVRMSPDLKLATVYVMPLGGQDVEGAIAALDRVKGELRTEVARRVNLKFAPQLRFRRDESADEAQRVARLLASPAVRRDLDAAPRGPEADAPDGAPDDTPTPLDRTSPGDDHGETR